MAASKMSEKRLRALEDAVQQACNAWAESAAYLEGYDGQAMAAEYRERAAQAQAALEVVKARFQR